MAYTIQFYTNASEIYALDKSLTSVFSANNVVFKAETRIESPTLILTASIKSFTGVNYFYIPELGRYYFLDSVKSIRNNQVEVTGRVDVLSTWKNEIRNNRGIVAKNANLWNLYVDDGTFRTYSNPLIATKKFPNGFTENHFVLAIAGA